MSSLSIDLNGKTLFASPTGELPDLSPVEVDDGTAVSMAPLSYGFFVFPEANAAACV
jgi:hypothetical protein